MRKVMALSLALLPWFAYAQVQPLTPEELQSMKGNFGAIARGETTERESLLKSEAGKHTIAGGRAADIGAKRSAPLQGDAPSNAAPGGPPGRPVEGVQYQTSDQPRNLSGPWSAMLITGTGELLDVPSGDRPGPQIVSPYEATRLCSGQSGLLSNGFNVRQREEQITLLLSGNYTRVRRIFMNGTHPPQPTPTFAGHSVGHWDGDTLVVDTVGLKGAIARLRDPVSLAFTHLTMATPTLHVVERVRKLAPDRLEIVSTYDDAKTGMKPYSMRVEYRFGAMDPEFEEVCEAVGDLFGPGYTQGVLK